MRETILTDDSVIVVETTARVANRYVSWHDIETRVDYDDSYEAPWEECDGYEHEFQKDHWSDHDDKQQSHAYVRRSAQDGGSGYIIIDDNTVVSRWGITRRNGESKQVWRERVAREKRRATEQLVKWYEHGWTWYGAVANYGDYIASVWGIDSEDYAWEVADDEMRDEVAAEMEKDGYIITDRPAPATAYSRVDAMRDRIRRNLAGP